MNSKVKSRRLLFAGLLAALMILSCGIAPAILTNKTATASTERVGVLSTSVAAPSGYDAAHVKAVFEFHYDVIFGAPNSNNSELVRIETNVGHAGGASLNYSTRRYYQDFRDGATGPFTRIIVVDFGTQGNASSAEVYVISSAVWARYNAPGYEPYGAPSGIFGVPLMNLDNAGARRYQNFKKGYIFFDAQNSAWAARIGFNWDAANNREFSVNNVDDIAGFWRGGSMNVPSNYTDTGTTSGTRRTLDEIRAAMKDSYTDIKENVYDIGVADEEGVTVWWSTSGATFTSGVLIEGMIIQGLRGGESTSTPMWNKTGMLVYNPVDNKAYAITGVVFSNIGTLFYTPGYPLGNSFMHNGDTYQNFLNGYIRVTRGGVAMFTRDKFYVPVNTPSVNKSGLYTAIAAVEMLFFWEYTMETWYEVEAALNTAKIVASAEEGRFTQAIVNLVLRDLNTARFALERVSTEPIDPIVVANRVIELIGALPSPVTLANEADVTVARIAYDALTPVQQGFVSNYLVLLSAETRITNLKAANAVITLIGALPSPIVLTAEPDVIAARNAYDLLTSAQRALVTNYSALMLAEAEIEEIKNPGGETADPAAAAAVSGLIGALPAQVTLANEVAVVAARIAYDALNTLTKILVTNYPALQTAEAAIADIKAAGTVIAAIGALPVSVTLADETAVIAARAAYTAITTAQQALVTNYQALQAAETAIANIKAANIADNLAADAVIALIGALPATIALADEAAVAAARNAYDELTPAQQALVTNYAVLQAAEAAIAELKKGGCSGSLNGIGTVTAVLTGLFMIAVAFVLTRKREEKVI